MLGMDIFEIAFPMLHSDGVILMVRVVTGTHGKSCTGPRYFSSSEYLQHIVVNATRQIL